MKKPIFKNIHGEMVQILPVPLGNTVTVRPGRYVIGEYFKRYEQDKKFKQVDEKLEDIDPKLIDYEV